MIYPVDSVIQLLNNPGQTSGSRNKWTNHEATAPPITKILKRGIFNFYLILKQVLALTSLNSLLIYFQFLLALNMLTIAHLTSSVYTFSEAQMFNNSCNDVKKDKIFQNSTCTFSIECNTELLHRSQLNWELDVYITFWMVPL